MKSDGSVPPAYLENAGKDMAFRILPYKMQDDYRRARSEWRGIYTAQLTVLNFDYNRDEEVVVRTNITAEVLDVTFPDAAYSDTAVGMWGGWMYERNGVECDSPEGEALRKEYYDYLLDYKITVYETLPYDILDPRADAYMSDPRVKSFKIPYPWEDDERLLAYYNKVQSNPEWAAKAFFYEVDEPDSADKVNRYMEMAERRSACAQATTWSRPFIPGSSATAAGTMTTWRSKTDAAISSAP